MRHHGEKLTELGLTSLKERRHQADMLQVYKILMGKNRLNSKTWFRMADNKTVRSRQVAGLVNIVKPRTQLDVRNHVFSIRTVIAEIDCRTK
jgi:hypothetical protein